MKDLNYDPAEEEFDNVVFRIDGIRLNKLKGNKGEVTFITNDYSLAQSLARKAYVYIVDLLKSLIAQCERDIDMEDSPIIIGEIRDDVNKFEKQLKGVLASGKQNNEFQCANGKPQPQQNKPKNKQKRPQKPQKKQPDNKHSPKQKKSQGKPKNKKHKKGNS